MTTLQKNALGTTPIPESLVAAAMATFGSKYKGIADLCLSHERLRAEVMGAEIMLADAAKVEAAALKLCRELQCPAMEYLNEHVQNAWSELLSLVVKKGGETR